MKLIYTFIFSSLLAFGYSQSVTKPLITKRTATWCPHCGSWGWDAIETLIDEYHGEKATVLALHHSGDLANELNTALADNFPTSGQPKFALNGSNINMGSSNWQTTVSGLNSDIEMINVVTKSAIALNVTLLNDNLNADVTVQNSGLDEGNYSIGLYLITDKFEANQAGLGSVAHHKYVYKLLSQNTFGDALWADGQSEQNITYDLTLTEAEMDLLSGQEVAAILWKNEGDHYAPINTQTTQITLTSSTIDDVVQEAKIWQDEMNNINIDVRQTVDGDAVLYSLTGRKLATTTIHNGMANFDESATLGRGIYIIHITVNGDKKAYKFILK